LPTTAAGGQLYKTQLLMLAVCVIMLC